MENNILFFFGLFFAWCGIFGFRLLLLSLACSFLNRVSPLPSILLPPICRPAGRRHSTSSSHTRPRTGRRPPCYRPTTPPTHLAPACFPPRSFLPTRTERVQIAGTAPFTRTILLRNGSQKTSGCFREYAISLQLLVRPPPGIFLPFHLAFNQTLDALPSHILTPFNGPVPPSNLLDKIARGVAEAKGPANWPHSQRATRAKIVELAQRRARDSTPIVGIAEESCEEEEPREVLRPSSRINRRRPLYRQSSMDFIPDVELTKKDNIKDNQSINRSVGRWSFSPLQLLD